MTRHFLRLAIAATLIGLAAAVPVRAGDETCRPEPVTVNTPSGIAGCTLDGPTRGKASHWNGSTIAANWCVYPWTDCGMVTIRSLETGRVITRQVGMFCDCWWTTDRRLVDLDRAAVQALGLRWADGLYKVVVTPAASMPDTSL